MVIKQSKLSSGEELQSQESDQVTSPKKSNTNEQSEVIIRPISFDLSQIRVP